MHDLASSGVDHEIGVLLDFFRLDIRDEHIVDSRHSTVWVTSSDDSIQTLSTELQVTLKGMEAAFHHVRFKYTNIRCDLRNANRLGFKLF